MFDGKAFGREIVEAVKGHIDRVVGPVSERLAALEKRLETLPAAGVGENAVRLMIDGEIASLKSAIAAVQEFVPAPALPDIDALVAEAVKSHVPDEAEIAALVRSAVAVIPTPKDGASVTLDDVTPLIEAAVAKAVDALPAPKDGASVTLDDVTPVIETAVRKAVDALPKPQDGKDGIGLAGAMQDKDGNLIVTLSNGVLANVGRVAGWDGADVDTEQVRRQIKEMFDALPKPKDGIDGLGFDDLECLYDGRKTVTLRFVRGDRVKEFALAMPIVLYRGVYKEGETYLAGDSVTFGGSQWIALEETSDKPGVGQSGAKSWQLAVKRGADGKDGIIKPAAEQKTVKI